jgi:hypothetical protein
MGLTVNGVLIAEEKIAEEVARLRPEYEAYVRTNGGEPSEAQLLEWAEEDVIEESLFRQEALATQPMPSDERAQQHLDASPEMYKDVPQADRLTRGKEALQQRRLMKEIRKGVKQPTEAEIHAYYDAHPEQFLVPETLRMSHICRFVEPGQKSDAFLDLLRVKSEVDGFRLNWVEAVESCSDSFSQDNGLFSPVSQGDFPPEIEAKLFALKPGEISDVIELGARSLHLFRLLVKEPARTLDVNDIQSRLSEVLFEEACQRALEAKFDALKAAAVIRREA